MEIASAQAERFYDNHSYQKINLHDGWNSHNSAIGLRHLAQATVLPSHRASAIAPMTLFRAIVPVPSCLGQISTLQPCDRWSGKAPHHQR
jgi:hypothetical protein